MPTAVVVGAGIGGLAVAGALARNDWNVTLIERTDRLSADQAGLLLWPSGVTAMQRLGRGIGVSSFTAARSMPWPSSASFSILPR